MGVPLRPGLRPGRQEEREAGPRLRGGLVLGFGADDELGFNRDQLRPDHRDRDGLHIRVVNLSFGVDARRSYVREPLAYAAEQLWQRGVTVVAAAGNQADGTGRLDLPAADPFLIAVGASDTGGTAATADDTVADFSSRDANRPPDVVAPGTGVISLPCREDRVLFSEQIVSRADLAAPATTILRGAFDALWNAFGVAASPSYDKDGRWHPSSA